jgi:uncharacterized repeat protein (TIGR01451 family)
MPRSSRNHRSSEAARRNFISDTTIAMDAFRKFFSLALSWSLICAAICCAGTAFAERPTRLQGPERKRPSPTRALAPAAVQTVSEPKASIASAGEITTQSFGAAYSNTPPPSASFEALPGDGTALKADTHGAVGPNHLMVTLNTEVRIQNRSGGQISRISLDGWWRTAGQTASATNVTDPRVVYDPYGGRFIFSANNDDSGPNPGLLIAVSATSDPTGVWYKRFIDINATAPVFADSPTLGFSRDWIVLSTDTYSNAAPYGFKSAEIFVYNKTDFYANGSATPMTNFSYVDDFRIVPVITYDPDFGTNYLVSMFSGFVEGYPEETDTSGVLALYAITGPVTAPTLIFTNASYPVTSRLWADEAYANMAPQLGTPNRIFLGDARITSATWRRGTIQVAHTVFVPHVNPTRAAVQWWEFTEDTTINVGRIDGGESGARMYAYPSIAANRNNDLIIGFTRFATNEYPSSAYVYREDLDDFDDERPQVIFKAGNAPYYRPNSSGENLWGDWSATVIDPLNDTDFWTIQPYAEFPQGGNDRWGTWWARVSPPNDLALTVTDSPDPVVAGSNLTYTITVTNLLETSGGRDISGVRISNSLPAGVTYVSASAGCGNFGGVVICDLGTLTNLTRATVSIVVKPTIVGTISNTFTVHANGPDADYTDNVVTVATTTQPSADLQVFLAESQDPVTVGSNLIYTVTITNNGPAEATLVRLTNNLPVSCTFVSATPSGGTCANAGQIVNCNLPNLLPNATATVLVTARPNTGAITISNRVNVASAIIDTIGGNNAASILTYVNARPTITPIGNQTIAEDTSTNLSFTIGDAEPGTLQLATSSSTPTVIPQGNVVLGGSGASRNVTITPAPNQWGSSIISISVTDGQGASSNITFTVNVASVNDVPTITAISDPPVISEDSSTADLPFTIGDVETTDPNALTLSANSSDLALVPIANVQFGGSGANRTVRVVPATNATGSATITVTVSDGMASSNRTFRVMVDPVNDRPAISAIPNRTVSEDTGTGAIAFNIIDVENGGALSLTATSSNGALAPTNNIVFGGSGTNRTVAIQPVANESGMAQITITTSDGSLSDSTMFSLTVASVNDVPTLNALSNITTNEDAGQIVIPLSGISSGAGNENQALTVIVDNSDPTVIASPIMVNYTSPQSSGTLVLQTVNNAVGSSTINVTVRDDGTSNNVVVRSFTVTLTNINDAPVISAIANRTTDEDVATPAIPFSIGDVEKSADALTLTAGSSDITKVPLSNITFDGTGNNRTVTVLPATDQNGSVTITVRVSDGEITTSTNFTLTINPVNDLPRFVAPAPDVTIAEDASTTNRFAVGDPEGTAESLTVTAATSNSELIPLSNIQLGGSGSNRTVVLAPMANKFGSATITLSLTDGQETTVDSFQFNVTEVNDVPRIIGTLANQTIVEDSTTSVISFTVEDEETLAGSLTMSGASSDQALVPTNNIVFGGAGTSNRTVRVTPAPNQFGTATITLTVSDGVMMSSRPFTLTVTPINDPPVISSVPNVVTNEDFPTIALPFTIRDPETLAQNLLLSVSSSNPEVVEQSGITLGGSATNRTVTVRPLTNQFGSATITINVTDASNAVATAEFEVTFNEVNDPPAISGLGNFSVNEDTNAVTISFGIDDPETLPQNLTVMASSSTQGLVPNSNVIPGGSGGTRTLTMIPLTNQFGMTTISVGVSDGTVTNTGTFVLTVNPVNDRPTISSIANRTIAEDTSTPVLSVVVGDVDNDPGTLTLSATSSNPTVIPVSGINPGGAGANRTVVVTPAADQFGSALITVTVTDSGTPALAASSSFTVTVTPVNDAPTINAMANVTVAEGAGEQTVNLSGVGPGGINENNPLVVSAVSSNPSLIPQPMVTYSSPQATGTLRFTPVANASGTAIITVTVDDGQSINRWTRRSFTVSVTDSNDAPTISNIPNLTTGEDTPISAQVIIGDIESPPSALTLAGTSSNVGLLANSNITFHGSGSVRTVLLIPTLNQFGTSTVTVTLSDPAGGTATDTFLLTVIGTNDAPTLDPIRDVFANQGAASSTITLTGISSGAANESQTLTLSNNITTNIFQTAPAIIYTSPNATATLSYRPGSGSPGASVVTVTVRESTNVNPTISRAFTIYVKPTANTAPTISTIANRTTGEDMPISIPFVITDAQTPANLLTVRALSTNFTLLPSNSFAFSGTGSNRTLTITPAANLSGSAGVNVSVIDTNFGGVSINFLLTVTNVNDRPVISGLGGSRTILVNRATAGSSTGPLPFTISDVETPAANLVLSATSSNPSLVPVGNVVFGGSGTNRSVTVTPALDQLGSASINVVVTDANGARATNTFNVNVIGSVSTPLTIARSGDAVTLSWANNAGNLTLQSRPAIPEPAAWSDAPETPVLNAGQNTISQILTGHTRLYRLRGQ